MDFSELAKVRIQRQKRHFDSIFEVVTAFMIVEMGGYSHPLFIPALYDVVFFLYDLYYLLDP